MKLNIPRKLSALHLLLLVAGSIFFGFFVSEYKKPIYYTLKQDLLPLFIPKEQKPDFWSVGFASGKDLSSLEVASSEINPILTTKDITDIRADFIADPFLFEHNGTYHAFFEILNSDTKQGDIGYATSSNLKTWDYQNIVLDEEFHLSYPYVFSWEGDIYMIPESHEDLSVRLYKASSFPNEWEYVTKLLSGYHYVDASIVRHNDLWWLFVTIPDSDLLNVYYSEMLESNWMPHPQNPVVRDNKHFARPGGRIISHEGKLIRFAQDDAPYYGIQVYALEIKQLTTEYYEETLLYDQPILGPSNQIGWNKRGMHHIDPVWLNGEWNAIVDGRSR